MAEGEVKPLKIEELLQRDVYDVDLEPHIIVDSEKCMQCPTKPCLTTCPASCYVLAGDKVVFSYEGCVECGTCRVVCPMGAIKWNYPKSGRGIMYRFT